MVQLEARGTEAAVEAEWRRRRKVFRIYLALLALPVLAAGLALARGRSEREILTQETILPVVRSQVEETLSPAVDTAIQERAPDLVAAAVREEIAPVLAKVESAATLRADLSTLRQSVDGRVDALAGEVAEARRASAVLADVEPRLERAMAAASQAAETGARSREEVAGLQAELGRLAAEVRANTEETRALRAKVTDLERQGDTLRRDIGTLRRLRESTERPSPPG